MKSQLFTERLSYKVGLIIVYLGALLSSVTMNSFVLNVPYPIFELKLDSILVLGISAQILGLFRGELRSWCTLFVVTSVIYLFRHSPLLPLLFVLAISSVTDIKKYKSLIIISFILTVLSSIFLIKELDSAVFTLTNSMMLWLSIPVVLRLITDPGLAKERYFHLMLSLPFLDFLFINSGLNELAVYNGLAVVGLMLIISNLWIVRSNSYTDEKGHIYWVLPIIMLCFSCGMTVEGYIIGALHGLTLVRDELLKMPLLKRAKHGHLILLPQCFFLFSYPVWIIGSLFGSLSDLVDEKVALLYVLAIACAHSLWLFRFYVHDNKNKRLEINKPEWQVIAPVVVFYLAVPLLLLVQHQQMGLGGIGEIWIQVALYVLTTMVIFSIIFFSGDFTKKKLKSLPCGGPNNVWSRVTEPFISHAEYTIYHVINAIFGRTKWLVSGAQENIRLLLDLQLNRGVENNLLKIVGIVGVSTVFFLIVLGGISE